MAIRSERLIEPVLIWPAAVGALVRKALFGVATNPIILGIAAGFAWSLLGLPMPKILASTVGNVAVLATPLGLMALGAEFRFRLRAGAWAPLPWQAS